MRAIEAEINRRRGEPDHRTEIPLTNFRGIEIRNFPAEIARLALIIAEYQCDVTYRGPKLALADFLPLDAENWITCGNALRLKWLSVCPPIGTGVKQTADDLFATPLDQAQIDFENQGGETYICGNPPHRGSKWQNDEQKSDLRIAWSQHPQLSKITDYVTGWLAQAQTYLASSCKCAAAFVMTNSVVQGQQAGDLWAALFKSGIGIVFARQSFKWQNLASNNAGVTVVVVGITMRPSGKRLLYDGDQERTVDDIGCFLVANQQATVIARDHPISDLQHMVFGNMPRDGGHLILNRDEAQSVCRTLPKLIRRYIGSQELIDGVPRFCLWIDDCHLEQAQSNGFIMRRLESVRSKRLASKAESTRKFASQPYRFVQRAGTALNLTVAVPGVSSEYREYLPCDLLGSNAVISNKNFGIFDASLWNISLIVSRMHWVWIGTVCVRMRTDFSYSNSLGWNTFPVPNLTAKNKADLTRCAEDILLTREAHFPATIGDLYDPDAMPPDLRAAHERNDEALERIYIGRRFRNDTERLEKLFELYTKMTAERAAPAKAKRPKAGAAA